MPKGSKDRGTANGRWILLTAALAASQLCAPVVGASEISAIATVASEYIYRGQARSDGDPVVQLGVDYQHDSGLFAGAWVSTIDVRSQFSERDTELDYYLGYHYAPEGPLALTATLVRYTYPGQVGPIDYDYNEMLITATLNDRHSVEFAFTDDYYGLGRIGRNWELRTEYPVANAWVLSAGLGRHDLSDFGIPRYSHWDLGASARFLRLTIDLRWHGNDGSGTGQESADSRFVVSLSAAF